MVENQQALPAILTGHAKPDKKQYIPSRRRNWRNNLHVIEGLNERIIKKTKDSLYNFTNIKFVQLGNMTLPIFHLPAALKLT